jgi:ABC-type glycerol-3-phosphate transport system permease component
MTALPRRQAAERAARVWATLAVGCAGLVCAFPFVWMLLASFKSDPEIFRTFPLLPQAFPVDHYRALFAGGFAFARHLANSVAVAGLQTLLVLALTVPAGFAFAQYRFPGRRLLYGAALVTVALPPAALALPLFSWMNRLGLYDTLAALVLPGLPSGLGLVFFTLVFRRLPGELLAVARSEGASESRVLLTLLPLVGPAVATFGLVHFVLAWHEHLVPLVLTGSTARKTLPLALAGVQTGAARVPYGVLMAASVLATVPTAAAYLVVRRHFRSALAEAAAP